MPMPPALPPEFAEVPFSLAEARASGVPSARLRRADLVAPFRGVRAGALPRSALERAHAYAPRLRPGQLFSHATAAQLWGMWLPAWLELEQHVDVLAVHPAERPRARSVRGHRSRSVPAGLAHGLPVVWAPAVWVQLAARLNTDELIAAGDSLVRRNKPVCNLKDLSLALETRAPGVARARAALSRVRPSVDSARETRLRLLLARAGLPEAEVNGLIVLRSGRLTHGDLVFREWRVLCEYDGKQHRVTARQFSIDVLRLEDLAGTRWTVIRVLAGHFDDELEIIARVEAALRDNGWHGRVSRGQFMRALQRRS